MSIRSVRSSSANWRSWCRSSLRRSSGRSTWSSSGVLVLGMFMRSNLLLAEPVNSGRLHAFDAFRAACAQNDFFQPAFRRFQFFIAMRLQRLAAFVQGDGIFQIHFALLQARDNAFQLLERRLEAQAVDGGRLARGGLRRNGMLQRLSGFGDVRNGAAP